MSDNKFKNPWGEEDPQGLEEIIRKGQEKFAKFIASKGGRNGKGGKGFFDDNGFRLNINKNLLIVAGLVLAVMWLSTGFYTVQQDEEGVVTRFGKYNRTSSPGLNYKLPAPVENVTMISVTRIVNEEIGYRSSGKKTPTQQQLLESTVSTESQMLTTDENIVDINFSVQWVIKDAREFLFNVRDLNTENTVRNVAESAMREVIGLSTISNVMAEERSKVELDAKKLMQAMLNAYERGVEIKRVQLLRVDPPQEVIDAYADVQNAKQDNEGEVNRSQAYRNDIVPRARGEAEKILQDAEGYKSKVIAEAQGDAKRFDAIYEQYRVAKDVTRKRMYIDTMEEVLSNIDKIIIDKSTSGVVPYLPLNEINKNKGSKKDE